LSYPAAKQYCLLDFYRPDDADYVRRAWQRQIVRKPENADFARKMRTLWKEMRGKDIP
jgi:hypothetical protein